jgi:hypothetical protein
MAAVYGWQGKLGISSGSPVTIRYNFVVADMALEETLHNNSGDSATRDELALRTRLNSRAPDGTIGFEPTPIEWYALLEWILGGTGSGTSLPLADTLPTRFITLDDTVDVKTWDGCVAGRATISSGQQQPLKLDLEVNGIDEALGAAASFPAIAFDDTFGPYMHADGVFVINSVTVRPKQWSLTIENMPDTERYFNSNTRINIPSKGRRFTWNFQLPYGDYAAAYGLQAADVGCSATFTAGAFSLAFSSTRVRFPRQGPKGRGREEEIMLVPNGVARMAVGGVPITVTCDKTP